MAKMSVKPGTGAVTQHGLNRQNERGAGVKNQPFEPASARKGNDSKATKVDSTKWKSNANPNPPNVGEAKNTKPKVHMTPKINEGTGGQPDGAKRVINTENKTAGRNAAVGKSTYKAPRNDSIGSPVDSGYTRIKM